jgi:hypothetical protein
MDYDQVFVEQLDLFKVRLDELTSSLEEAHYLIRALDARIDYQERGDVIKDLDYS